MSQVFSVVVFATISSIVALAQQQQVLMSL